MLRSSGGSAPHCRCPSLASRSTTCLDAQLFDTVARPSFAAFDGAQLSRVGGRRSGAQSSSCRSRVVPETVQESRNPGTSPTSVGNGAGELRSSSLRPVGVDFGLWARIWPDVHSRTAAVSRGMTGSRLTNQPAQLLRVGCAILRRLTTQPQSQLGARRRIESARLASYRVRCFR